jgi:methylglutaconyl-CoA hydratase
MESGLTLDERGVATYTIDEAATRNALSTSVLEDIERALMALKHDPVVRVVVFTGAGGVFSSGADRAELGDPTTIDRTTRLLSSVLALIDDSAVPVVGRVNGAAFGAGLAILAAADISIASDDAVFGLPEVRFGLVAGPAAAACLGRIGQTAALDVLLTGRRFGAAEAERMHLLAKVVGRDELDGTVEQCIAELLLGDTDAVTTTRRMVRRLSGTSLAERVRAARDVSEAASRRPPERQQAGPGDRGRAERR